MLISGIASGYLNVLWDTGLQRLIPSAVLSRVSSYDWFASMVFLPVGYAIVGPISNWLGNAQTLWIAAALQVFVSLSLLMVVSRRAIWEVRF
jgi:hypothetical protein